MAKNKMTKKDIENTGTVLVVGGVAYIASLIFEVLSAMFYPLTLLYLGSIFIALVYYALMLNVRLPHWLSAYSSARDIAIRRAKDLSNIYEEYSDLRLTNQGLYDERSYRGKDANIIVPQAVEARDKASHQFNAALSPFKTYYMLLACAWGFFAAGLFFLLYPSLSFLFALAAAQAISLTLGLIIRSGVNAQGCAEKAIVSQQSTALTKPKLYWAIGALMAGCVFFLVKPQESHDLLQQNTASEILQKDAGAISDVSDVVHIWPTQKKGFVTRRADARTDIKDAHSFETLEAGVELIVTGESTDGQWIQVQLQDGGVYYMPAIAVAVFSD